MTIEKDMKCDDNVHDKGAVEITTSSVSRYGSAPRNAIDLRDRDSWFLSTNELGQWICPHFKTLRTEPTYFAIRMYEFDYLDSRAAEGSTTSIMEGNRPVREQQWLNDEYAVKMFAASRPC
jgi:hypothetical protein